MQSDISDSQGRDVDAPAVKEYGSSSDQMEFMNIALAVLWFFEYFVEATE